MSWKSYSRITRLSPSTILIVNLVEVVVLVLLLLARAFKWAGVDMLPALIGGVVPLIVPWAGALGGVTISLVGLISHWEQGGPINAAEAVVPQAAVKEHLYNPWHLTRLWVGATFGTFAALTVVLITKTIGLTASGGVDVTPTGAATLALISFVVGYREHTFRLLVDRVVDTILGPGSTTGAAAVFELTPPTLDFKAHDRNTVTALAVTLKNAGDTVLRPSAPVIEGVGFSVGTTQLGTLAAGASEQIVIRFSPTVAGPATGSLSITVEGTTKTVALAGTANP